jgi:glycosyltransferase involved in cell wall biosynthesis
MRVRAFPNSSASRHWRLEAPFKYLRRRGIDAQVLNQPISEDVIRGFDWVVLQGCVDKDGIALLHYYQENRGLKIAVDQDDLIEVEENNPHKKEHEVKQAAEVVKITLGIADLVTTTNKYLQRELSQYSDKVVVLPNYMDMEYWDIPKAKPEDHQLRIGWAGSITHLSDLAMIAPVIDSLGEEFPEVKWIFVGEPRAEQLFSPKLNAEYMLGVPFEAWATKLHGLRFDIGMAPLQRTTFNKAKSNIKYLEYAIAKIPAVYSKIVYSRRNMDSRFRGIVAENLIEWRNGLHNLIVSGNLRKDIANCAYAHVRQQYDIKDHIDEWMEAYHLTVT